MVLLEVGRRVGVGGCDRMDEHPAGVAHLLLGRLARHGYDDGRRSGRGSGGRRGCRRGRDVVVVVVRAVVMGFGGRRHDDGGADEQTRDGEKRGESRRQSGIGRLVGTEDGAQQ